MDAIKKRLLEMKVFNNEESQIKILQGINTLLLTEYALKIDDNFIIYPIEVEAYYFGYGFKDDTIHGNELQKNRFGKLYFHRKGKSSDNKILFRRSGIDLCLSDSDAYDFGVLIRSARINQEPNIIGGPQLLAQRVYKHICMNEALTSLSEPNRSLLTSFEKDTVALTHSDARSVKLIIHSSRIGLNPKSKDVERKDAKKKYADKNLRSLSDLSISKQKEKDVVEYMRYNKIEATLENVKDLLGYNSNTIIEKLKN